MGMRVVVQTAILMCDKGSSQPPLMASCRTAKFGGQWAANILDNVPGTNIPSFGRCGILNSPCSPDTPDPWTPVLQTVNLSAPAPMLSEGAILPCKHGGIIQIVYPGQTAISIACKQPPVKMCEALPPGMSASGGSGGSGGDSAGGNACGAQASGPSACGTQYTACGAAASTETACGVDATACGAAASAYTACGVEASACGAAASAYSACGVEYAACGAQAGGGSVCGADMGSCGVDVAGYEACGAEGPCAADACGADACIVDLTIFDLGIVDVCAVDIIPVVPFI